MYYGWLEEFIASINNEQRKTLGFPDITTLPNEIKQAVLLRYKKIYQNYNYFFLFLFVLLFFL